MSFKDRLAQRAEMNNRDAEIRKFWEGEHEKALIAFPEKIKQLYSDFIEDGTCTFKKKLYIDGDQHGYELIFHMSYHAIYFIPQGLLYLGPDSIVSNTVLKVRMSYYTDEIPDYTLFVEGPSSNFAYKYSKPRSNWRWELTRKRLDKIFMKWFEI